MLCIQKEIEDLEKRVLCVQVDSLLLFNVCIFNSISSPEAERGGEPGTEGPAEGVASSTTRPGESPAAAGADPQEGEAQERRGME